MSISRGLLAGACSVISMQIAFAQQASSPARPVDYRDATYGKVLQSRSDLLSSMRPVTDEMLASPSNGDWLTWRRTFSNESASKLDQLTPSTVGNLRVAWSWSLPASPNEIAPLVHDGVLFINSANRVQALDATSGDLLWQYTRALPPAASNGVYAISRNIALYADRVFVATADNHLVALNAKTGEVVWDKEIVPAGVSRAALTGGPMVVKGKVIQGVSNCFTLKGGCYLVGLDASTGEESWRFYSIARPGEPGGDTWNDTPVDERFGGSMWTAGAYDPKLGLVYYGIGQTYDAATLLIPKAPAKAVSKNDALYTNATVALDPETGKLVWHYQHFNRDVWDMDWVFERTLATVRYKGADRDVVFTMGKLGIYDVLDRKTGQYLFSRDVGLQNLVTSIDPRTGRKTPDPKLEPQPNVPAFVCPFAGGARNWPTTAYDAAKGVLYIPLQEACMDFTWAPRDAAATAAGGSDIRWTIRPPVNSDGNYGRLQAVDLLSGKPLWTQRRRAAQASSLVLTQGGLLFDGSRDRLFRASDAATGMVLWETRLNGAPSSSPLTYSVGEKQYVAVVTGGGGPQETTFSALTPEIQNPTGAVTLWVFSLPGNQR